MRGRNWLLIALAFSAFLLIICLSAINVVIAEYSFFSRSPSSVQRTRFRCRFPSPM